MVLLSSITSSRRAIGIAALGAVLLAGCGVGGDSGSAQQAPRLLASTAVVAPPVAPGSIRVHFHRAAGDTGQWGVYSWDGPQNVNYEWIKGRFMMTQADDFGGYVDIPVNQTRPGLSFLVTDGNGTKNCESDQYAAFSSDIGAQGQEIWLLEGDCKIYTSEPPVSYGNLQQAAAIWLSADTLVWPGTPSTGSYKLYYAANGGLGSAPQGVTGADGSIDLAIGGALNPNYKARYPHLANATALTMSAQDAAALRDKASHQFAIAQFDANGKLMQVTSLQSAGMLDALFAGTAANARLGLTFDSAGVPTFRVWAPTAKSVSLNVYPDADSASSATVAMTRDGASGVWTYTAPDASWTNRFYYTYTVKVLSRWAANSVVTNVVTDPYSLSLNANGKRSFVANLDSPALKPAGWDEQRIPKLDHPSDIALYELHVRDFSISDSTVPSAHRGTFMAFTNTESNGMRHLRQLQKSGLTHIHLLPAFDIASVDETGCATPAIPSAGATATVQQEAVAAAENSDCFNWGYDPTHYTTPEGSYTTNANDGILRVREFRSMVQALHEQGLRVTMDVVYNHTSGSQQGPTSVLDKIVPTYYYRLNDKGGILNDSCCADTASENAMMAKLMIDSVVTWATQYKVDSFRFDIMGLHPLPLIGRVQQAVNQAAGRPIYLYGEAWNFGAVGNDARFQQARQANMFGTGIGSFNDRIRDTVRGGGCCDSGDSLLNQQGFINGVYLDPNGHSTQTKDDLLRLSDLARVALSGTLRDYAFVDRFGNLRKNWELDYFGQRAGFAANPLETINYIEAHDNQTLFDINAFKLPANTPLADRVRVQNLGAAITLLAQGVPFIHAGQEILRSKSMDRDSYNAGDWFNKLDYSYQSNNFGVGMPMYHVNQANWHLISPVLANPLIKPDHAAIVSARDTFNELLAIRKDSSLFRLRTAQDVQQRLKFYNVGPTQEAGVVAMHLVGDGYKDAKYKSVTVLFNVDKVAREVAIGELKGRKLAVHPIQRQSTSDTLAKTSTYNPANGAFVVPPRTTVVFVENAR
jgi:pullulanase/glycogen debranching enzyme